MSKYRIVAVEQLKKDGLEIKIAGPGIPASGVVYWFASEQEARSFIEILNLSYSESKQFSRWRRSFCHPRVKAAAAAH